MMSDYTDLTQERDRELVIAFASSAHNLRAHFRLWIQEELKDLAARADSIEPILQGQVKGELNRTIERIREIDRVILGESVQSLQQKIEEIEGGVYEDIFDAQGYLNEGLTRLEGLVRELLRIRDSLNDLWESHTEPRR